MRKRVRQHFCVNRREFFKGSFDDLAAVAEAVPTPLLCKDFMIHKVQIRFAKASGASIILLIVAA